MTIDPRRRLSDAYAAAGDDPGGKRRRRLAATHRPDERSERLLRLRRDDPAAFARLDPTTRMAVGHYEAAKAAHEEEEASR